MMSEYTDLTTKRDELLAKLREIEENCAGIENEHNAQKVQELNIEQAQLKSQKQELSAKLSVIEEKLSAINFEINKLSGTGIDRILEAIKNQRWYFFKNKPKILMDKLTGILWANLDYFPWRERNTKNDCYSVRKAKQFIQNYTVDGFDTWLLPSIENIKFILQSDNSFPFKKNNSNLILDECKWIINKGHLNLYDFKVYYTDNTSDSKFNDSFYSSYLLPCNYSLIQNSDYANNVSEDNKIYTEKERLQFTLDLFVQNGLIPIFDNEEITDLFKKIYFEKPHLIEQLQEVQAQLDKLQTVVLLSSEFDYTQLLAKYNLAEIDKSVIKYYQAVQLWTDELMDKLSYFEQQKEDVINDFNLISLKLSKKYEENDNLTAEENSLLQKRQQFFKSRLSLGMNTVKNQLLLVKQQADDLEQRIDDINNDENSFALMAELESEKRPSFAFVAENTATIVKNALKKIEYFEANRRFVVAAIDIWEKWTEDYKVFKTKDREELKNSTEQDGIDESIWQSWYKDWQKIRFNIEEKIQPALARGLKGDIPTEKENEITVIEQLIRCLEMYKEDIDKFYLEERKGIYQKYAFAPSGDLQDKFETESELYKRTVKFQSDLQEIIFSCTKTADRMFILKWAENLSDIQIDEIIAFVADRDLQQISHEVLQSFSRLKQKNYDAYLNDAKAYSQEKANREKQYNSLMFKMRSELNKQK